MVHWTNLSAKTKRANMSEFSNLEPFARLNNKRLGRINQHAHRGEAHISMHAGEKHQSACTQGRGINGMHTEGNHQHAHRERIPPAWTQGGRLPPSCTQGGDTHEHALVLWTSLFAANKRGHMSELVNFILLYRLVPKEIVYSSPNKAENSPTTNLKQQMTMSKQYAADNRNKWGAITCIRSISTLLIQKPIIKLTTKQRTHRNR